MRSFLIKGQSLEAKATYNENELLCLLEITQVSASDTHFDFQVIKGFLKWLPTNTTDIETAMATKGPIMVTEIAPDLSFTAFWTTYDYKIGNKSRAEATWNKLKTEERNACMLKVKQYKNWLKVNPTIAHLYAETFLSQRRWENEFKI